MYSYIPGGHNFFDKIRTNACVPVSGIICDTLSCSSGLHYCWFAPGKGNRDAVLSPGMYGAGVGRKDALLLATLRNVTGTVVPVADHLFSEELGKHSKRE